MKALVTAFDAFARGRVNPSLLAVRRLKHQIGRLAIYPVELPTSYARSPIVLRAAIQEIEPNIVLGVGQAGGRAELCLERVAINVQDARIKDWPVVREGPAAYFSTLPIKACLAEMRRAGLPAALSNSAGTFICNHVFYVAMDTAERSDRWFRGGFLHVPYLPEQAARVAGAPSMSLHDIVRGIEIVLAISAVRHTDIRAVEGRIS
jgi:pyroglutamyl-peptidase